MEEASVAARFAKEDVWKLANILGKERQIRVF